ncbi:MAG: DUF2335 domain-containing protein [Bryobacteraceae bacterium]
MSEQIGRPPTPPPPPLGKQPGYAAIAVESFAGPIPPPQILQGYETACPGAAHRII